MFLTHEKYLKLCDELPGNYWKEGKNYRWKYIEYVIGIMRTICPDEKRICEAGTNGIALSSESTKLNYPEYDLNKILYDVKDKFFNLFVALQVWEHLDNQQLAFEEVMRISKSAILSFPYKWPKGKGHDSRHVGIDDRKIKQWTCGVKPEKTKLINNRMVCVWIFK